MIDTHCHLNDSKAFPDATQVIAEAVSKGVHGFVVIGVDLESSQRAVSLAEQNSNVWAVIGQHPNYAHEYNPSSLPAFKNLASHEKVVAIGEIGFDFHWDYATLDEQTAAYEDFMELAMQTGKPVVFHCREAYPHLLQLLEARTAHPKGYLLHCFAGDLEQAQRAIALGAYFGVDGPITYKSANTLREVVSSLPRERVLLETDSPYMSPVPHRGKPNSPAYIPLINQQLAQIWGVTDTQSAQATTENAERFFGL